MHVGKRKEATPDVTSETTATVLVVHNKLELTARGVNIAEAFNLGASTRHPPITMMAKKATFARFRPV